MVLHRVRIIPSVSRFGIWESRIGNCRRIRINGADSRFSYGKMTSASRDCSGPFGGMAERLKAHVLKTCLGHTNVGSNPTPSARFTISDLRLTIRNRKSKIVNRKLNWGGARVVEWGRLLSGYWGEILSRRFESCPPRHTENAFRKKRDFAFSRMPPLMGWYSNPAVRFPPRQTRS